MTKATIHFRDSTPDLELRGVREVKFKDGVVKWTYHDPKGNGLTTNGLEIAQIAYVEIGAE